VRRGQKEEVTMAKVVKLDDGYLWEAHGRISKAPNCDPKKQKVAKKVTLADKYVWVASGKKKPKSKTGS
jgi:hypothetical protein